MTQRPLPPITLASWRQGDPVAFAQLYKGYRPLLLRTITYLVNDSQQAEDLLQDTFVKVWLHRHRYDPEQGTLSSWLLRVARNTTLDFLRQPRQVHLSLGTEHDYALGLPCYWPVVHTIGLASVTRQALRPEQWAVIELAYWQGYTHTEIAQQLGLPLGTVKSRVQQAVKRLRPLFT